MSTLRKYQLRDYKNIIDNWNECNNILYQLPTGGGKSVLIEHIILNYKTEKILVLAHKRELVFQMKERLESNGLKVGIIIGNIEENTDSNIVVASIRTVAGDKRISTILDKNFDRIIIDEAHHIRTSSYENVLDQYINQHPKLKILGVTATPYRKDKKPLNKYFQTLICSDDVRSLQEQGFLSKFKVFYTPVKDIDKEVESSGNDYQLQSLSSYMRRPEILQFLVDSYIKQGENKQMIVFCVDKKHAKDVQEIYKKNKFTSIGHIDSDTKLEDRREILLKFKNNQLQIITCIETLTEGVDLPETGCIQLARPTQSLVLYLQMVGRGSRIKSDGGCCIILDNAGCTIEHKAPDSPKEWSLNPNINPNHPGKKNRIVAKRTNGTYTEDENEMSFLELVEMTPEEYALNMSDGIEKSEQHNLDIKNKCIQLLTELGQYILSKQRNNNITYKAITSNSYYENNKVTFRYKDIGIFDVTYFKGFKYISFDSSLNLYSISSIERSKNKIDFYINYGKFIDDIFKEKTIQYIIEQFQAIEELNESIVDIHELKQKIKGFKRDQLKLNLERRLITNPTIKIEGTLNLGSWFRDSYWSNTANEIIFEKNKLLSTNNITFKMNGQRVKDYKSVKIDKILDILENKEII